MKQPLVPIGPDGYENRRISHIYRFIDRVLKLIGHGKKQGGPIPQPQKILLVNCTHIGDIIVSTSVLPLLKQRFPDAQFGFLAASWAEFVLDGHPDLSWVHVYDNILHNRSSDPFLKKLRQHLTTRYQALKEVRAVKYDVAIDLRWTCGTAMHFLYEARIPVRIGYTTVGFGPLATHPIAYEPGFKHISERTASLLKPLGIDPKNYLDMLPELPIPTDTPALDAIGISGPIAVCHPSGNEAVKLWPIEKWRTLTKMLTDEGLTLLFTGHGDSERELIDRIIDGNERCHNMCGKLPWKEYVATIAKAKFVVCADTAAGHVASAARIPAMVITTGRSPYLWRPLGRAARQIYHVTPCSPCHIGRGCPEMECVRLVEPQKCLDEIHQLMLDAER